MTDLTGRRPEVWLSVDGWPYEVSSLGRVRRTLPEKNTWVGRVLRPNTDKDGYPYVRLSRDGKVHDFKIHVLVCQAFHGKRPTPVHEVRHLNGKPSDNVESNLLWGTVKENAIDRDRHGRQARGENTYQATLTDQQVVDLRSEIAVLRIGRIRIPRGSRKVLAEKYGVCVNTLSCIAKGESYL